MYIYVYNISCMMVWKLVKTRMPVMIHARMCYFRLGRRPS